MITIYALTLAAVAAPATSTTPAPLLGAVLVCRTEASDAARLRCFDAAAAALGAASDAGKVVIVDREDIRRTRRSLFGFNLPTLPFFGGDESQSDDEPDIVDATVKSARALGYDKWAFELDNGAIWQTTEPGRNTQPSAGQSVRIKKASMGSYMVSFRNARSVRAMRVR